VPEGRSRSALAEYPGNDLLTRTKLEEVSMFQRTVFRRIFVLSVFLGLAATQDAVAYFVVNGRF
jgi:hypothetical protein